MFAPHIGWEPRGLREPVQQAPGTPPGGGTVTTRIRSDGIAVLQVSRTRSRSCRSQNAVASGSDATSGSRTAAMKSCHVVVLPVITFCCHADTTVRAMSRAVTMTCTRRGPKLRTTRRTWRGRASPSSSSETSTSVPGWLAASSTSRWKAPAEAALSPRTRWPSRSYAARRWARCRPPG